MTSESSASDLAEWILLRTLPDLKTRIESPDDYDRLGIAHLLRRLLLDAQPVVHLARRRLRIPAPLFTYSPYDHAASRLPQGLPLYMAGGFDDSDSEGSLSAFLAAPLGQFRGDPVTVRMVIRYVAHVDGGVHIGTPSDDFEAYIQEGLANFPLIARGMLLNTLVDVGSVVLRAMRPLSARLTAAAG